MWGLIVSKLVMIITLIATRYLKSLSVQLPSLGVKRQVVLIEKF